MSSSASSSPVVAYEVEYCYPVHLWLFHLVLQFKVNYEESRTVKFAENSLPIWTGFVVGTFSTVNAAGSPLVLAVIECEGAAFGSSHTVPVATVPPGVPVPAISGTGGVSATHSGYAPVLYAGFSRVGTSSGSKLRSPLRIQ